MKKNKAMPSPSEGGCLHYVYILLCSDGSLYTGWTTHLEKRVQTHNKGLGAKYTKGRLPVRLVYYEILSQKSQALKRERAIKKLTRGEKLSLIRGFSEKPAL